MKLRFGSEWGFMGFMDLDGFDPVPKERRAGGPWTPESVLANAVTQMNAGRGFFWGSAETSNHMAINPTNFDALASSARKRFDGAIELPTGRLGLTNCASLSAIAEDFPEEWLPFADDIEWLTAPGCYSVEVLQFSRYDGSEQCIGDVDPDFEDESLHLAVRLLKVESRHQAPCQSIPNQPGFYRLD